MGQRCRLCSGDAQPACGRAARARHDGYIDKQKAKPALCPPVAPIRGDPPGTGSEELGYLTA
jgi:hypothetical protein